MRKIRIAYLLAALLPVASYAQVVGGGPVIGGGGTGGSGTIGGTLTATDNLPICTDGTGGSTIGACTVAAFPTGSAGAPSITLGTAATGFYRDGDVGSTFFGFAASTPSFRFGQAEVNFVSNGFISWGNQVNTFASASSDSGIKRQAAGVVRATNGASGYGAFISGNLVEENTAGSGAPNVLADTESGTVLTNEGSTAANYHTLPTAAAGRFFTHCVQDADGMRVVANTSDTIRVIDKVTAAAGYIESTTIGACVTLQAINAVEWFATSVNGTWTDGTFTFDNTSLTTP